MESGTGGERKVSIKSVTGKATRVMRKWRKDATMTMTIVCELVKC